MIFIPNLLWKYNKSNASRLRLFAGRNRFTDVTMVEVLCYGAMAYFLLDIKRSPYICCICINL